MWTAAFWKAAGERAIRTFAQALLAVLGADVVSVVNVDWPYALGVAVLAALLSVLTSVAASGVGGVGPSLGTESLTGEAGRHAK